MADGSPRCLSIIVAGMIAGDPGQGGATWAVMQYVLGLQSLGHDVLVIDPIDGSDVSTDVANYFDLIVAEFGLVGRAALMPTGTAPHGVDVHELEAFIDRSTVLINLSGRWRDRERFERIPVRIYLDLDPGFTQLWHEQGGDVGLAGHTHHVTVGARLGRDAAVPSLDLAWRSILPPVLLERWPVCSTVPRAGLTTVANWRSYGSIDHDGRHFGQKAHAFRALSALPHSTDVPIAIALSIHPGDEADRSRLLQTGWRLVDPVSAAGNPDRYRRFIQSSWAELGVAKTGYVVGRTGWVSDRSACYLASGRPVVAQDTGLDGVLPIGAGLIPFDDADGAAAAIEMLASSYSFHAEAARRLAESHFDARSILADLVGWAHS